MNSAWIRLALLAAPALLAILPARAEELATQLRETVSYLPVSVVLRTGRRHRGRFIVTHYRPKGPGPFPGVIFNHGRSAKKRGKVPRFRFVKHAQFWIRRGFAVFVPTRIGYGEAGLKPDPEIGGPCRGRNYDRVLAAMVEQNVAAADFARSLAWVDGSRLLVTGASYGGFAAIGAVARRIPGVIGGINFAGGAGGNAERRSGRPCAARRLGRTLWRQGRRARLPMLWLYSQNDRYWGAQWPRRWYAAYRRGGGMAELHVFPPIADDGHKVLSKGFALWRPVVDRFIAKLGFEPPRARRAPPPSGFARVDDLSRLPFRGRRARRGYQKFLTKDVPRAFAFGPGGRWAWYGGVRNAVRKALRRCSRRGRWTCKLYAVDDSVVWQP